MSGAGKVVCVTGATGYIASWLVKLLLLRGYTVHATVRDPNDTSKVKHLMGLEGAKERLHFFKADLLEEGSFDAAVSESHAVFHTASPVIFSVKDPQVDVLDPALKGTLNVLTSCRKYPSVRRVLLTSSLAAVVNNGMPRAPDVVVDESWFSDPELCNKSAKWYSLSKTLAENAAWKFAKENGIDMVVMNPGMVIGPMLQPTLNESVAIILNFINGAKAFGNITFSWVDIRDVATAHILAFEDPSANGRYCLSETVAHFSDIVEMLRQLYPMLTLPDRCADDEAFASLYQVSKQKAESLGIQFTSLKVSLKDTVENLKGNGFVSF